MGRTGESRVIIHPKVSPGVHEVTRLTGYIHPVRAPGMSTRASLVSEGGLEPPPPYRGLGPQPSASTNSATPTKQPAEYTRDTLWNQRPERACRGVSIPPLNVSSPHLRFTNRPQCASLTSALC